MVKQELEFMYDTVCEAPSGSGFHIDHMPDFLIEDDIDNSKPHVHKFYEIIWFWEAGGTHTVDFHDYEIETNSIFFLSPGQVHHFDGVTHHKGVALKFCTDFLRDEQENEDIFIKYNAFNAYDTTPYYVISDDDIAQRLHTIVEKLELEQRFSGEFGHIDMIRAFMKIFMILVYRHGHKQDTCSLETIKASHRLFVMFRGLLEQNYDSLHTVKDYADRLNVSSKTLSNSVIECSGRTPLTFINERILLEAKRLVCFTDILVKEIAFRLGYDDPSYFVKFFKRQTGMLPQELRKETAHTRQ